MRLLSVLLLLAACSGPAERPSVVVSTTLLASIVEAVGGGEFNVKTVAPAIACPGHFDIRPADVVAASQARLIICRGWEQWFPNFAAAVENAVKASGTKPEFVTARTQGNWMIPDVHKAAVAELTDLLVRLAPDKASALRRNAERYSARVDSTATEARRLVAGIPLPATIASDKQVPFLRWLGLRVVAEYGRSEDCSAQELARLARVALDSSVALVVDNLQSGPEAGLPLAEALGARHVTLTNFPLDAGYPETLLDNVRQLKAAVTD